MNKNYIKFNLNLYSIMSNFIIKLISFNKRITINREFIRYKNKFSLNNDNNKLNINVYSLEGNKIYSKESEYIGEFDQDGNILFYKEPLPEFKYVTKESFLPRKRYKIKLLRIGNILAVEKKYNNNKIAFLNELKALEALQHSNIVVPKLISVDFDKTTIIFSYINGSNLQDLLHQEGANLLDKDLGIIGSNNDRNKWESYYFRIKEGKKYLYKIITDDDINNLKNDINNIHKYNVLINDIKYGNIMLLKDNSFGILDFESSFTFKDNSLLLKILAKNDKNLFKMFFDKKVEIL